jgi:hypothetical protein
MNFEVEAATGLMLTLMSKKEPLRSDLWAYLAHDTGTSDGLMLQHPLLHVVGVKMEGAAWINHLLQTAEEAAAKALAEERWLDYVLLHEPPYRLAVFGKLAKTLSHAVYWKSLGVLYIKTEDIWQRKRQLAKHFASDRPHRKQLMSAYDIGWNSQLSADVEAGAVPNHGSMFIGAERLRELLQKQIDDFRVQLRTQKTLRVSRFRAHRAEYPQVLVFGLPNRRRS